MSTHPPSPLNPSQAVERIREIIVGRQLDRLEQRVSRLEEHSGIASGDHWNDDRLSLLEARLEALQDTLQRSPGREREEYERRALAQQQDIQRLSARIQQVAAEAAAPFGEVHRLEEKLGHWLTEWRDSFLHHLQSREHEMTRRFREELDTLRHQTERKTVGPGIIMPDPAELELRFQRIAAAARALADSACPPTSHPPTHG